MFCNKRGQVWVETVIYTLIALVMIGTVVSVVKPKIEESRDKAIIEQSLSLMKSIDSIFFDIKGAPGNQRVIELGITDGNLLIDAENDRIVFELESRYKYSEPGKNIEDGASGIIIHTEEKGKFNNVTLTKNYYEDYNLTYSGRDELKFITKSSAPYRVTILNKGQNQFTDSSSTCTEANVEVRCANPLYSLDYTKSCVNGLCKYVSTKLTINLEVG